MIAGHAPLAFALGASLAIVLRRDRHEALTIGLVAGAFALVPDIDMVYAVAGLLGSGTTELWSATAAFWAHSTAVHRAATHSLVVSLAAAVAFSLAGNRRTSFVAYAALCGLVGLELLLTDALAAAIMALFAVAGLGVTSGARRIGFDRGTILIAALVGLVSHPFGDLFTGQPPPLLYPFDVPVLTDRIALVADPTLNLLAVFGLELAMIWLGVVAAGRLLEAPVFHHIDRRAAIGAGYGAAVFFVPPPTLDVSYQFVFSVVAVGAVGIAPLTQRIDRRGIVTAALTGLAAMTLGGLAYTAVYLVT